MMEGKLDGYFEKLRQRCEYSTSTLCIGLDPDPRRIPAGIGNGPEGIYRFCADVIEATADYAAAYKPNLAFFESIGTEGWHVLAQALEHVPRDIPVIVDAKRGDIGSTALHYARSIFDRLKADAVTVNPLLGHDSVEPFLQFEHRGIYLLCLTSNPGASDFQLPERLYIRIAEAASKWNTAGNLGLVVGATNPAQVREIQESAPGLPMLIPGLGAQGGSVEQLLSEAQRTPPHHMLFNVSRSIIYASAESADFARASRKAAQAYRDMINQARERNIDD